MLKEIIGIFSSKQKILITTHVHPDGDGLGAGLALLQALKSRGKDVIFYCNDPVPFNFRFLPGAEDIVTTLDDREFDLTVVVDCAEEERLGSAIPPPEKRGFVICIDHHLDGEKCFGDICFSDETASAVGEMVYYIIVAMEVKISVAIATCIYSSILSDTGSFRYSNTTPAALKIASEMLGYGVNAWETAFYIYEMSPVRRLKLLSIVLETLQMAAGGKAASIFVTKEMFRKTNADVDMIDGFINYARGIEGVEVAIQFRELEDRKGYKVSFRSKGKVNVAAISSHFGGGGHFNAAGCIIAGTLEEVKKKVYSKVKDFLSTDEPSI